MCTAAVYISHSNSILGGGCSKARLIEFLLVILPEGDFERQPTNFSGRFIAPKKPEIYETNNMLGRAEAP